MAKLSCDIEIWTTSGGLSRWFFNLWVGSCVVMLPVIEETLILIIFII